MAIFKCKMCGGNLEVTEGMTICECEYCGTNQTVPNGDDEKKTNLFNRANRQRIASEFDRAAGVYETIVAEFPQEAEGYWGLCLCEYGIEYVDDPRTAKKIPTCHRTTTVSIFESSSYKSALAYADPVAKTVYQAEAKAIDDIQKGILEIANKEDPFDIFICYKETDESGRRTPDSVLAQDLYDELTERGYKVFFSRITLEDKLGQEYEPYIFAALSSARVMLAIGTKSEYYDAVWVKNEWSRYLSLMQEDRKKTLIPCYRDMDAYDMPAEFKNLQGQDMGRLGFVQDLVRGIDKVFGRNSASQAMTKQAVSSTNSNAENLLKRGWLALEDGKWKEANDFFENVLNENAEEARAYLGKLMAELQLRKEEDFQSHVGEIKGYDNFKKAMRFGDRTLKTKLENYDKQGVYNEAVRKMQQANSEESFKTAASQFQKLDSYKSAKEQAKKCLVFAEERRKSEIYNRAISLKREDTIEDLKEAIRVLKNISGFQDADDEIERCKNRIKEILDEEIEEVHQEKELEENELNEIKEINKARNRVIASVMLVILVLALVILVLAAMGF